MSDNNRATNINYTTIDFDAIKSELIQYLKETGTYKDVDFASSNINTITGLYSYLGSLFGYYINSIANEPFLPSAKRYKNLNRIARLLSYNPRGFKSSTVDVIGNLDSQYCLGKENQFFEIPAYSIFPSTMNTPAGDDFTFTNPNNIVYMVKGFGTRPVEQGDFSYAGNRLPHTASSSFWETEGTTGTPSFSPSEITLNLSDKSPLSVLNRLSRNNFKGYDAENVPLFNPSNASSVGQPFTRTITMKETTLRIQPNTTYFILFTYDTEQSRPFLEIFSENDLLEERRDDIITSVRLTPEDTGGQFWSLREVSNNAQGKFYLGVLGMSNLESVDFTFDRIEATEAGIRRVHLDINKDRTDPPWQVLVNGVVYNFTSGRISSQIFDNNTWDVNQPEYNINLTIVTPDAPNFNYDAKLNVTSKAPNINEVTIAKIFPSYNDPETGTPTILRESGQRFGNFQLVPQINVETSEQRSGIINFSEGVTQAFISFDVPFTPPSSDNLEYAVTLTPSENVQVWFTNKSEEGFSINVEPNTSFDGNVSWVATKIDPKETREFNVSFDEPIPQIEGADAPYTIFLTPSDNVNVWYENQSRNGFTVKVEKSFTGTVSYSTFVFSDDQRVQEEIVGATQRRGTVTLNQNQLTRDITFDGEFSNNDYGLHMVSNKNVNVWYTNKTPTGFTINIEPETIDGNVVVDWFADFSPNYIFQKHGTINFAGQVSSAGTLPGLRFNNINETFIVKDLKQGNVRFSYINRNGTINSSNNQLGIRFTADRKDEKEIKFQISAENISYDDVRVFVKNEANDWEEWNNASVLTASTDISKGEKVFFSRIEDTRKIEISFGDGERFGVDPYGKEIIIFGMRTVGTDGNIPPNTLADNIVLSREILGDDNITIQFEQQFIQLLGLKSQTFFASDERTSNTAIYDSEGTRVDSDILTVSQNNPAFGGNDPEGTEELRFNASSANLRQDRVVSLDDYASFAKSAFGDIILKVEALSYKDAIKSGFIDSNNSNFFFNYIFLVVLPKVGTELSKKQKDFIINTLDQRFKAMATVEHAVFSAQNVPVDVRIRFKPIRNNAITSVQTNIERVVRDFFVRENRDLGETLHHSDLIASIKSRVSNVDYVEVAWHKNIDNKLTSSDYNISAVTEPNETVAEVKRRKILELIGKDPSLLTIVEPLLDVTDSNTGERKWVFTFNLEMDKFEFPVLGDIIIEVDGVD